MDKTVARFQKYVKTYKPELACDKDVFIKDMLYGIGIAIDRKYKFFNGFELWKKDLLKHLED